MHLLTIHREGAAPSRAELADGVYTIGAGEHCRIRLPARGVSERHAILTLRNPRDVHYESELPRVDFPQIEAELQALNEERQKSTRRPAGSR